jgi:hypothetical protein
VLFVKLVYRVATKLCLRAAIKLGYYVVLKLGYRACLQQKTIGGIIILLLLD